MGMTNAAMPAVSQTATQLPQRTNMVGQPVTGGASMFGDNAQPSAQQAAQAISGGKGGQPPSPQALSQGLQQQAAMQSAVNAGKGGQPPAPSGMAASGLAGQTPMTMQRQPQGGMAGPNAAPRQQRFTTRGLQVR